MEAGPAWDPALPHASAGEAPHAPAPSSRSAQPRGPPPAADWLHFRCAGLVPHGPLLVPGDAQRRPARRAPGRPAAGPTAGAVPRGRDCRRSRRCLSAPGCAAEHGHGGSGRYPLPLPWPDVRRRRALPGCPLPARPPGAGAVAPAHLSHRRRALWTAMDLPVAAGGRAARYSRDASVGRSGLPAGRVSLLPDGLLCRSPA